MKVPYSYLPDQFGDPEPFMAGIAEVVRRGDFTLGAEVARLEEKFAAHIGTAHAVGVNSGTDALFLALKAAGVGPGDEVITAANTFIATAGAIVQAGARPVFVDVTDEYVMDPDRVEKAVNARTKAIMPVHWAGVCADMDAILSIAKHHALPVVEDSCQAIGASLGGRRAGSFGLAGGFSLHPLKNLNVWGDGGMIVTDSAMVADRLRLLRNHGLADRDTVVTFGYNSRLDSVQAAVGLQLIESLDWITETRQKWASMLDAALADLPQIRVPRRRPDKEYVHHLYIVEAQNRDELLKHLVDAGVEAKIHYPVPLHLQPACERLGYKKGDFPVAEAQAKKIITLPVHQHLSQEQVEYVIEKVRSFYK
ncbi:MAG: DegT/DnrJ/EryC1/StrS family aminotransferase [Deltaproteobacteria bacterium]|nr:DegT/DnrJ/EryC1/StrS family aminotransferase [Deltaproteobacteria bacterium]